MIIAGTFFFSSQSPRGTVRYIMSVMNISIVRHNAVQRVELNFKNVIFMQICFHESFYKTFL